MVEFNIERLVPKFILYDTEGHALAKAIEAALKYMCDRVETGYALIDDVDTMPDWRLDELAWEYGMDWYEYDSTIERRRAQVKGVTEYYKRLGTPEAVRRVVEDVYMDGRVVEWFDYEGGDGEPYHFSVYTGTVSSALERRKRFMELLEQVKNVRSVLDNLYYFGSGETPAAHIMTRVLSQTIEEHVTAGE